MPKASQKTLFRQVNQLAKRTRDETIAIERTSIDDLPLSDEQKKAVLEWFANKIWRAGVKYSGEFHHKSYDPLTIDDDLTCHSYVLALDEEGGRHYDFESLTEIEEALDRAHHEEIEYIARTLNDPDNNP